MQRTTQCTSKTKHKITCKKITKDIAYCGIKNQWVQLFCGNKPFLTMERNEFIFEPSKQCHPYKLCFEVATYQQQVRGPNFTDMVTLKHLKTKQILAVKWDAGTGEPHIYAEKPERELDLIKIHQSLFERPSPRSPLKSVFCKDNSRDYFLAMDNGNRLVLKNQGNEFFFHTRRCFACYSS